MWIKIIYDLSAGDITKTETVLAMNYITCLIWLSYRRENNV